MSNLILSVLMLAGAALLIGGIYVLRKGVNKRQGLLMLVAAAVMFGNVWIGSIPIAQNNQPVAEQSGN
ncbi:MAG: hypothetical protein ABJF89_15595 [Parasphingorhabdus sp.]|uniref:hypothetical protein n=2 Tax=Parasphingorhabdus sp. TaxID=2709688 RepID=UPI0032630BE3